MSILKGAEDMLSKSDDTYNSAFLGADLELDGSRRREISLYRSDEVVLSVEHGITLGLLKLIYSADSNFEGILQGVRSRPNSHQSLVASVILSDDRVLDQDDYDLIVQDQPNQADIMQQTIETKLPLQSSSIAPPSQPNSLYVTNPNTSSKNMGQFVCEFCHLPFVSKAKFLRHRRIHTDENPYVCVYCNDTFSHHAELRKHRDENHMTNKTFKCTYCPKTFATRAELKGHLWRHTGEKNHKCRICGKTFATKGNLKLHIDKHIGVHKHKCPFCPQRFTSHSSLEAHMAKHTGMKAYKCRFCPKSYSQAGQLTSHERLHTGEKPFICEVCGKQFRLNSTRLAHEKRHTGDRPHICDTCGRSFSMPDHLRRHLKTHENKLDRLVSCPFCKKKIFAGRNMRKHLARHRELGITETQAKAISGSLKPDREQNERDSIEYDQRSVSSSVSKTKSTIRCIECNDEVKSTRKLIEHLSEEHYHRELTALERKEIRLRHGLQKLHHCQFCSSHFIDYRLLRSHVLAEHAEHAEDVGIVAKGGNKNTNASHRCPNCSLFFHLRSALEMHVIRDHLSNYMDVNDSEEPLLQFRCWYCSKSFQSPEEVVNHMTNEHESLDVLSKRVELTTTEDEITSSGLWTCAYCSETLKNEIGYRKHIDQHQQEPSCSLVRLQVEVKAEKTVVEESVEDNDDCVVKKYLKSDANFTITEKPTLKIPTISSGCNKGDSNHGKKEELEFDNMVISSQENKNGIAQNFVSQLAEIQNGKRCCAEVNTSNISNSPTDNHAQFTVTSKTTTSLEQQSNITNNVNINREAHTMKTKKLKKKKKEKKRIKRMKHQRDGDYTSSTIDSCQFRSGVFEDKTELQLHTKAVHEDGSSIPFRCWFCSVAFSSPEDVVCHMTNEHDNLDNLSRRIEIAEMKSPSNAGNNDSKTSALKPTTLNASLSPVDSYRCSKCPKQLESKEAYELHIMVHENSHSHDLLKTGAELLARHRIVGRTNIDDEPLSEVHMEIDNASSGFGNIHSNASSGFGNIHSNASSGFGSIHDNDHFDFTRTLMTAIAPSIKMETTLPAPVTSMAKANADGKICSKFDDDKAPVNEYTNIIQKTVEKKKNEVSSESSTNKARKPKRIETSRKARNALIVDGSINVAVNICVHCSRAFCGKKALDVHTLKMHGKEYLQRQPQQRSSSPFTCWFCSLRFISPELVVEHMTTAHENLDMLSKRIEDQDGLSNLITLVNRDKVTSKMTDLSTKYTAIALQKPVATASTFLSCVNSTVSVASQSSDTSTHLPPGFKMSYALAYVPIFVPDKNEEDGSVNDNKS